MKVKMIGAAILVLAHLAVTVRATEIADKKTLTLDGARHAISAAVTQAHKNHAGGAIAVVDDGGNLLALERVGAGGRHIRRRSKYCPREGPHRLSLPEPHARVRGNHREGSYCHGCSQ